MAPHVLGIGYSYDEYGITAASWVNYDIEFDYADNIRQAAAMLAYKEYICVAICADVISQEDLECAARRKILCKRYSTKVKNGAGKQGEFWPKSLVYRKPWRSERYARRHGVNAGLAAVAY